MAATSWWRYAFFVRHATRTQAKKRAVQGRASKPKTRGRRPEAVVIRAPASIRRTERTFGVDAKRSKEIDALIEEVVG
jgi:hypothetical protein